MYVIGIQWIMSCIINHIYKPFYDYNTSYYYILTDSVALAQQFVRKHVWGEVTHIPSHFIPEVELEPQI